MIVILLMVLAGFDTAVFRLGMLWGFIALAAELLAAILTFRYWDPTGY